MPNRRVLLSLALVAAASVAPACASGSLVDVQIVDRSQGQALPTYHRFGSAWVAGQPGNRYAVQLVNRTGGRVLVVLSVDGINAITGETAGVGQSGYVLGPWESAEITGWRKSAAEAAAFYFTSIADSYAARTDRPDNVGVIGAAVFRERTWRPPEPRSYGVPTPYSSRELRDRAQGAGGLAGDTTERGTAEGAAADRDAAERREAPRGAAADGAARSPAGESGGRMAQAPAPANRLDSAPPVAKSESRLGTGHGEREYSPVTQVAFERASSQPAEVVRVRYDSWRNLVAMGVVDTPRASWQPEAFPRWAPDPR